MRADQIKRLEELSERLVDLVLDEADPVNWPGNGKLPRELTREERGDRHWCKKGAAGTFSLVNHVESMLSDARELDPHGKPHQRDDLDEQINDAERRAEKMLARAMSKAKAVTGGKAA